MRKTGFLNRERSIISLNDSRNSAGTLTPQHLLLSASCSFTACTKYSLLAWYVCMPQCFCFLRLHIIMLQLGMSAHHNASAWYICIPQCFFLLGTSAQCFCWVHLHTQCFCFLHLYTTMLLLGMSAYHNACAGYIYGPKCFCSDVYIPKMLLLGRSTYQNVSAKLTNILRLCLNSQLNPCSL